MVGVFVAIGLIVISILDLFGIARDSADALPFHYVHNIWNLFFGVLMIFMDAPAKWLGKGAVWQTALWQKAPSLGKARTVCVAMCGLCGSMPGGVRGETAKCKLMQVAS